MTHPLSDRICYEIEDAVNAPFSQTEVYIRAGADWQLEADAEWWRIILNEVGSFPPDTVDFVIEEFKQSMRAPGAMRPQQQEDSQ